MSHSLCDSHFKDCITDPEVSTSNHSRSKISQPREISLIVINQTPSLPDITNLGVLGEVLSQFVTTSLVGCQVGTFVTKLIHDVDDHMGFQKQTFVKSESNRERKSDFPQCLTYTNEDLVPSSFIYTLGTFGELERTEEKQVVILLSQPDLLESPENRVTKH